MAKIDDIYNAVDDFGLVTSSEAAELGMSNAELVQQARAGKLIRVARGVYRMPIWPSQPQAPFAIAVRATGEGAFLYGESVVALLQLAPTDPSKMWIAAPKRVRRNLGKGVRVIKSDADPTWIEGIPCQPLAAAIVCAAQTMGTDRALEAASEALRIGYLTESEKKEIKEKIER
ncbi:type IV toxin-antitoxin system AbiEi family antitoxin domain-containing protein [uncultured Olegusella sp.]|uniref:type IV toxin-antitoxin system AbiEi family antitoxin domain-containing protein n=1 Tax=uncultured Olegusella sp. TaxID=1979846 RepID=UPI00260A3F18|nr:type IV toxin-antitoxin system AbiEi family antitoxin domain-containing protein [uncultured Olegusella sp.]